MRVNDVMSSKPITISPDATVAEAIARMISARVSGLPVADGSGTLVGMLSEGDLLRRSEMGTQKARSRWLEWLIEPGRRAEDYTRANGRLVREVMTDNVYSIGDDASLADAVNLMEKHHVKRLPVVADGKLVGIVTRADLIRALARYVAPTYEDTFATDAEIAKAIRTELDAQSWAPAAAVDFDVKDGVVTLRGSIMDDRQRDALRVLVENVSGVKRVADQLVWIEPYTGVVIT